MTGNVDKAATDWKDLLQAVKSGKGPGCSRATFLYVYDQGGEYARVNIAIKRFVVGCIGITMRESNDDKCGYRFAEALMPSHVADCEARQRRSSKCTQLQ